MNLNVKMIKQRFNKASFSYEKEATVQRQAANFLVKKLNFYKQTSPETILDIGAGTGYLAEKMHHLFPKAHITLNDICPNMLEQAKTKFYANTLIDYLVTDMSKLSNHQYDYVVSNFAFQWANNLDSILKLAKTKAKKKFIFSTLFKGTFLEWEQRVQTYQDFLTLPYPTKEILCELCYPLAQKEEKFLYWVKDISLEFENSLSFIRYLKALGASTNFDKITFTTMKHFYSQPFEPLTITYKIFFGLFDLETK